MECSWHVYRGGKKRYREKRWQNFKLSSKNFDKNPNPNPGNVFFFFSLRLNGGGGGGGTRTIIETIFTM